MAKATDTPVPSLHVDVADIEKALNRLWDTLHADDEGEVGVTRACMSNLIIACQSEAQAMDVAAGIPQLVELHPARVFLLTELTRNDLSIDVQVSAHCRRADGGKQLCSEHVDIRFHPERVDRLGSVLRPLLIGDLPTALWWASNQPPPASGDYFATLADLSDQVIYNSVGWPNPAEGVRLMARWVSSEQRPVFNLAWRYLKPWRRILAQVMDPQVAPGALENIQQITLTHGPHALPLSWLLVGWLASRLGWKPHKGKLQSGNKAQWVFKANGKDMQVEIIRLDEGSPQVYRLEMKWLGPNPGHAAFVYGDDEWLSLDAEHSTLPPAEIHARQPQKEAMIAAQLAHRAKDRLFQQAVGVVQKMGDVLGK